VTTFIRTFIAVSIPDTVRSQIAEFQRMLQQEKADIKWVRPESIHITLRFLGDVLIERAEEIGLVLEKNLGGISSFSLVLSKTGVFPNIHRPRVLWIGIANGVRELTDLCQRVSGSLEELGFEQEKRPFSVHVTLGRVRSPNRFSSTIEKMMTSGFHANPFQIENVFFMKSDLKPTGAEYTILKKIQLRG
jgi:2'-5' RNA ligase